jgi:hypothetical protein
VCEFNKNLIMKSSANAAVQNWMEITVQFLARFIPYSAKKSQFLSKITALV